MDGLQFREVRRTADGIEMEVTGVKHDSDKPRMSLLDRHALEEIARVMGFGAKKYAAHNWRKGLEMSRLLDAALRHINAYNDGEDKDPESGLSHLAHAGCCVMFALRMEKDRPDLDDRFKAYLGQTAKKTGDITFTKG